MKRDVPVGLSPFLIRVDEPAIAGRTDIATPLRRFIATAPAFDLGIRVHGRGGIGRPGYAARPAGDRMID